MPTCRVSSICATEWWMMFTTAWTYCTLTVNEHLPSPISTCSAVNLDLKVCSTERLPYPASHASTTVVSSKAKQCINGSGSAESTSPALYLRALQSTFDRACMAHLHAAPIMHAVNCHRDFNMTPGSWLYRFMEQGQLDLAMCQRPSMSGAASMHTREHVCPA